MNNLIFIMAITLIVGCLAVAIYEYVTGEKEIESENLQRKDSSNNYIYWNCYTCSNGHAYGIGVCKCGMTKEDTTKKSKWRCHFCSWENTVYDRNPRMNFCENCGSSWGKSMRAESKVYENLEGFSFTNNFKRIEGELKGKKIPGSSPVVAKVTPEIRYVRVDEVPAPGVLRSVSFDELKSELTPDDADIEKSGLSAIADMEVQNYIEAEKQYLAEIEYAARYAEN